jgi:hypothetical protein
MDEVAREPGKWSQSCRVENGGWNLPSDGEFRMPNAEWRMPNAEWGMSNVADPGAEAAH